MGKAVSIVLVSAVPAILGIGALYWLTFGERAHDFKKTLSQEDRRAVLVHAVPLPRAQLKIALDDSGGPVQMARVEFDGTDGVVYAVNNGRVRQCYLEAHTSLLSPDGTIIKGSEIYAPGAEGGLLKGDKVEIPFHIEPDPRAAALRVHLTYQSACGND